MNGIFKKLAEQTAIYGLSSIIGRLLNYLLVPIYTRKFLPSEYGVVTELYSYVGFLIVVFTYGMETAFFRFIKDSDQPKRVFGTVLMSLISSSLVFTGLLLLFAQPIADILQYSQHSEYMVWFALILGLDAIGSIPLANLRYQERPLKFAFIQLTKIGINIGLVLFWVVLCPEMGNDYPFIQQVYDPEMGVGYIFLANLIASAVAILLLLPEMRQADFSFDAKLWKKAIRYSLPLVVVGFAGSINEMLDRVLLKHLLPYDYETNMAQLGIYGAVYKLSILMTLFVQAFRYAVEPFFFARSKQADAKQIYAVVMQWFVAAGGVIFIGVVFFLDIFKHFIGTGYHEGLGVVPILLLANLFLGIYYNLSIWYKLSDQTMIGAYISIGGALITIVLNVAMIPYLGYVGSAWATLICYVVMVGASYLLCQKHFPIPYKVGAILAYVLLAGVLVLLEVYWIKTLPIVWAYVLRGLGILAYLGYLASQRKTLAA